MRLLALLLTCSLLQGCVGAAVVGGAAAVTGFVLYDKRNINTLAQDESTTRAIMHEVQKDRKMMRTSRVTVTTFKHNVLLLGQTPYPEVKREVQRLAENAPNVLRVYNEIKIGNPITNLTQSSDAWLTSKVKSTLLKEVGLKTSEVKVITENGTVYLMGTVSHARADKIIDVVRQVGGVQKVVKVFNYV